MRKPWSITFNWKSNDDPKPSEEKDFLEQNRSLQYSVNISNDSELNLKLSRKASQHLAMNLLGILWTFKFLSLFLHSKIWCLINKPNKACHVFSFVLPMRKFSTVKLHRAVIPGKFIIRATNPEAKISQRRNQWSIVSLFVSLFERKTMKDSVTWINFDWESRRMLSTDRCLLNRLRYFPGM